MAKKNTPRRSARERILAAASDLFYREGMQNVGIDRIIAESGVAKMSLYNNFKSKDELIAAYLEKRDQDWRTWFKTEVEKQAIKPGDRLLAIFDVLQAWAEEPDFRGCAFINSSVELANPEHPGYQVAVRHQNSIFNYVLSLTTDAAFEQPETLAQQLLILIEGAVVVAMMQGSSAIFQQAKQAAEMLMRS